MDTMRISELASRTGVPATTLRYYESAGLLASARTPAGYRMYGEAAVERLAFIGAGKNLGLPLEEIGELLAVWESGACRDVKADLRPRLAARLGEAERRAAELGAFTATLRRALAHLDALPERDARCGPECGLLAAGEGARVASSPVVPVAPPLAAPDAPPLASPERWRAEPVACSLDGAGTEERIAAWRRLVDGAEPAAVPDGLRFTLPAERLMAAAELAAAEQRCCPFFDFRLHLDGTELHMEVRAPAEGAAMLAGLFGATAV